MTITNTKSQRKDAKTQRTSKDFYGNSFFDLLGVLASLRWSFVLVQTLEGVAK